MRSIVIAVTAAMIATLSGAGSATALSRPKAVAVQRAQSRAAKQSARRVQHARQARRGRTAKHLKAKRSAAIARQESAPQITAGMGVLQARDKMRRTGRATHVRASGPSASVTITPTTNLAPGQSVHIVGQGLTPGSFLFIVQCAADAGNGVTDCDLSHYTPATIAPDGSVDLQRTASRHMRLSDGSIYDCGTAPSLCNISWVDLGNPQSTAAIPISFNPTAAPAITISATPSTNLVHLQTVNFNGTGPADDYVEIIECPTGADPFTCTNTARGYGPTDNQGHYADALNVRRVIGSTNGQVDCAVVDACELVAYQYGSLDLIARVSLSFDPNGPLPEPIVVTATPATGLLHLQDVSVSGTGFDPNDDIQLSECSLDASGQTDGCVYNSFHGATADAAGHFTTTFAVRRVIGTFNGSVDCAVGTCAIFAESYSGFGGSVLLSFDATVPPPPPPSITVTPATGLHHAQIVTVTGTNFDPNGRLYLRQCALDGSCRGNFNLLPVAGDGTFTTSIAVSRTIIDFSGTQVDCADVSAACSIDGIDFQSGFSATAPILFAPGPLPAPPTAALDTTKALHDGRGVHIVGSDWFPRSDLQVEQCASDSNGVVGCIYDYNQASIVNDDGTINIPFTPHRKVPVDTCGGCGLSARLKSHVPSTVDCIDEGITCTVRVADYTSNIEIALPMRFDRGAPLAPPPVIESTPTSKLRDRQTVLVKGKGFDAGAFVSLAVCEIDNPEGRCVSGIDVATDEAGAFSTPMIVRRAVGRTAANTVRLCDVADVKCAIFVYSPSAYLQIPPSIPIYFDRGSPVTHPTISANPTVGLIDGQTIAVTGTNFVANSQVVVIECAALTSPQFSCAGGAINFTTADANGNVTTSYNVVTSFVTQNGSTIDCTTGPGACVIVLGDLSATDLATAPLTFVTG